MNHHRTDRAISSIIGHLEALTVELPAARNALLDTRNRIDGYPGAIRYDEESRGERTVKVKVTDDDGNTVCDADGKIQYENIPITTIEAAAIQLEHIDRQLAGLNDELNAAALIVKHLRADCQRYTANPVLVPRCSATGRQGAIEWADPTCTEIPERTTLCIRCYHRERRWRIAHNLPTREDSAA